jgi:hypothetical protein
MTGDRSARDSRTWLAVVACLLVAEGCSSNECTASSCPTSHYDVRALPDSSVVWTFRGMPPQTTTGFVPNPPPDDRCSFTFNRGRIDQPVSDGGADRFNEGWFELRCGGGAQGQFDVVASVLGDPRTWSAGTFQMIADRRAVGIDYPGLGASPVASGCSTAYFPGLVVTVTVEAAVGGAEAFPKLVTDDYQRTFRVDFDTATATPTTNDGSCDFAVTTKASLHLTQTAADYVFEPNALCLCE